MRLLSMVSGVLDISHKLKIAVCEDQCGDAERLARYVNSCLADLGVSCELAIFTNCESFLCTFHPGSYDIVFLDIYLDSGMTGMQCAQQIRQSDLDCLIVFTTESQDHLLDGYRVEAVHYILKPVSKQDVNAALTRCLRHVLELEPKACTVLVERKPVRIPVRDIRYVEVRDKYCHIHTQGDVVITRTAISELEQQLPSPPFLLSHRCYLVNLNHVAGIDDDFVMEGGDRALIRRIGYKRVKEQYTRYLASLVNHS